MKESLSTRMSFLNKDVLELGREVSDKCKGMISNISFSSRQRYANMSVAELRECLAVALAEGGINE